MKSLQEFLQKAGFIAHPFGQRIAEEDKLLHHYFVRSRHFANIVGDPYLPKSSIYFAARGKGKSSTAYMIQHILTENKTGEYGAVLVVNINRDVFDDLVLGVEGDFAKINRAAYRKSLIQQTLTALAIQRERLEQYGAKALDSVEPADFKTLMLKLKEKGVTAIYFIIDGIDELDLTRKNPEKAYELILPLVTDLTFLEAPNVAAKFFLPLSLQELLENGNDVRFDRVDAFSMDSEWTQAELLELLQKRLEYYSNHKIPSLSFFTTVVDIDRYLCQQAAGSPRNLIRLGAYVIDEHLGENFQYISEAAIDRAVKRLHTDLKREGTYSVTPESINGAEAVVQEQELNESQEAVTPAGNNVSATAEKPVPPSDQFPKHITVTAASKLTIREQQVFIDGQRWDASFGKIERKILATLYDKRGAICTRDYLIAQAYGENVPASDEQLEARVKEIRKKLNDKQGKIFIKTVRSMGYILDNAV